MMPPVPEHLTVLEWIAVFFAISIVGLLGWAVRSLPRSIERATNQAVETARAERTEIVAAFERCTSAQLKAFREDAAEQRQHDSKRSAGIFEAIAEVKEDTTTLVARSQ